MKNKKVKKFPLVSVIMNCNNGEKYLIESIKSLVVQTYKNWELIFWDNQSYDNSQLIVSKLKDKRIKYFKSKKFNSLYYSRNLAINKAKGKYVAFLDVDDLWEKNKLEKQVEFFRKNKKIKVLYSNFYIINESRDKKKVAYKKLLPSGLITRKLLNNYTIGILTTILEKKIFKTYSFNNDLNIIGDFDFFFRISLKHQIGCIQSPLASYRVHENNLSKKRIDLHVEELQKWLKLNKKKLKRLSFKTFSILKLIIKLKIKQYLNFQGV